MPTCEECGVAFKPRRYWQKFCTKECRWKQWSRNHPRVDLTEENKGDKKVEGKKAAR